MAESAAGFPETRSTPMTMITIIAPVDAMFAHAYGICHVKDGEVDEQGKSTHVDLARTFAILKKRGYKGYCSIEYDAPGDPYQPTAELVKKTVQFLS